MCVARAVGHSHNSNKALQTRCPRRDIYSQHCCQESPIRPGKHHFSWGVPILSSSPQYRIDVVDSLSPPEVRPYLSGTPLSSTANSPATIPYPLRVHPRFKNEYFIPKQSFNLMGMLQNPMIMMMGAVGVMAIALPYMMVRAFSCSGIDLD